MKPDEALVEAEGGPLTRARASSGPSALMLGLSILLAWEIASRSALISPVYFPSPTRIVARFLREIFEGDLGLHVGVTVRRVVTALLAFGAPGLALGFLMGWSARMRRTVDPLVAAIHPLPKVAIYPLLLIILGLGEAPLLVAAGLASFFPCVVAAMAGVDQIRPVHFDVARSCGASSSLVLRRVVIPGSLPIVLAGLRLAFNTALMVTVSSEMVGAQRGIGAYLWFARETLRIENLYVGLLATALLGSAATGLLRFSAPRLLPWQPRRS